MYAQSLSFSASYFYVTADSSFKYVINAVIFLHFVVLPVHKQKTGVSRKIVCSRLDLLFND